jgi:hypothetical protein|tara:strand:- start:15746 stop:16012 length:267 start_codon:yes stop_codon:yes gene_type:complete
LYSPEPGKRFAELIGSFGVDVIIVSTLVSTLLITPINRILSLPAARFESLRFHERAALFGEVTPQRLFCLFSIWKLRFQSNDAARAPN